MSEWLIIFVLKGWLVVAVVLFIAMTVVSFLPGTRKRMERNANIPFMVEDEGDGKA